MIGIMLLIYADSFIKRNHFILKSCSFEVSMVNCYRILGLQNYASVAAVRKAYITQIKQYHPDVNSSHEAIEICKQLNVAKEALETEERKAVYDTRLKWHLWHSQNNARATTAHQTRPRTQSYSPPPVSATERAQRNKEYRDKIKLAEYAKGLETFRVEVRYLLCALYGAIGLYFLVFAFLNTDDLVIGLLIGLVVSALWFSAISLFVNEYYKYYDYLGRSKPLGFDLDKRTSRMFFLIYVSGFVFSILVKVASG
jgi:hypothetical protein